MVFQAPVFLLLLLLLPLVFFVPRRIGLRRGAWRAAVLALVALAAARPAMDVAESAPHWVFVIDFSKSADPASIESAKRRLTAVAEALPADARRHVVRCGAPLAVEDLPAGEPIVFDAPGAIGDASPLAAALAAADRAIPDGARGAVVLVSDGASTDGRSGAIAQRLAERGIPIHVLALERRAPDLYPVAIRAPEPLRAGRTGVVAVDVVATGGEADVRVSLKSADGAIDIAAEGRIAERGTIELSVEPRAAGFLGLVAEVRAVNAAADAEPANNRLAATLPVDDPLEVLYLGSRIRGAQAEIAKLAGPGFAWKTVDPSGDGEALAGVDPAGFDLVMIDDVPAARLSTADQAAVERAVADDGVGLLVSGGEGAFGPGGWLDAPLSKLMPVEFVQKEEKRDPSTTLVIIIDTSGSMMGSRIQLAKETARLAMRRLLPHDKCGIVEFHGAKRWAAPIQPASNTIDLQRALNRLNAGGGTVIFPAIEEAYYALQNVQTRYKHVLILTDGGVENGPFEALARQMSEKGITVSTVLTGPEAHSEFLVNIANWGKGRFYTAPNRYTLPEIILKQPTSARLPAYQSGGFTVRRRGSPAWTGSVDVEQAPKLAGYVETRTRTGAELVLETEKGHPLLVSWRWGAGRVSAFTSEPAGPGTEGWRDWPGFGPLADRLLRRSARTARVPFELEAERQGTRLVVRAHGGANGVMPAARVIGGGGEEGRELAFERRARDLWVAEIVADPRIEARIEAGAVVERDGKAVGRPARLVAPPGVVAEMQVDPEAVTAVEELARATGGKAALATSAGLEAAVAGGAGGLRTLRPLWPWLYLAALVLWIGEIAWRRRPSAPVEGVGA